MADVAFDKHALFCEEYVAKMAEVSEKMLCEGGHKTSSALRPNSLL